MQTTTHRTRCRSFRGGLGGTRATRRTSTRARCLRALLAHGELLHGLIHARRAPVGAPVPAASPLRTGLLATTGPLRTATSYAPVVTERAPVHVPANVDGGVWTIVYARRPHARRSLRRRWFPWTLEAWLTTADDGALALFAWERPGSR